MSEAIVIVNPIAGRGAGARLSPQVARSFQALGMEVEITTTQGPGHATALACQAAGQGHPIVVAVGGDGTVNEVLNGLVRANDAPGPTALGVLPVGTGNDFAFGAGIPLKLEDACQVIVRGESRLIDVGCVQADNESPLYFGNGVGLGFDAVVNIESRKLKRLRGFLVYLVAVLRTLIFYYQAPLIRMQIDGREIVQPSLMVSIMNGIRFGGGFYVTPESRMDDGLFDLCVAGKLSRPQMLAFVPRFMRGSHVTNSHVTMTQGRTVTVRSDTPWAGHVDGEIYGRDGCRFEMKLLPRRLRLIS